MSEALLAMLVKTALVMMAAGLAHVAVHRRVSAAARHLLWTFTIVGVLLLPLLATALPSWVAIPLEPATAPRAVATHLDELPSASAENPAAAEVLNATPAPVSASNDVERNGLNGSLPWTGLLIAAYIAGVVILLLRLILQRRAVRRLLGCAGEVTNPEWRRLLRECSRRLHVRRPVRLLQSVDGTMPMTCGIRRPSILIPSIASSWSADRRRAVLLHELAHVVRCDCLTQTLAGLACAVYWINPMTWWIARRLRVERELACDDRVLAVGTEARDYADHLLEIAFALGRTRVPAIAVSMARPGQLEGRMLAVLDDARNRSLPSMRGALGGAIALSLVLLPLAGAGAAVMETYEEPAMSVAPAADSSNEAQGASKPKDAPQAPAVAPSQDLPERGRTAGTWQIRPSTKTAGMVHLQLTEDRSTTGTTIPADRFEGLTAAQLAGASGPVRFTLRREAGSFLFEGVFRDGVGGGTFTFAPNPSFPAELAKRGLATPTSAQQYSLARADVGVAFVDELKKQGYGAFDVNQLVRAGEHGVNLTYVREMADVGYRFNSLDVLVKQRDHGITPTYVRELAAEGYKNLSADALLRARDHGVTPDFVREFRSHGYGTLTLDQLVTARDHGVSGTFVREMSELGYAQLPLEALVRARDHGVSPEFARELAALGYAKLPVETLIRVRDHGVTPGTVKELKDLGYNLSLDQHITLRDHGVTAEFVRELTALGYRNLPAEMLVRLRDHGVTATFVRELKDLGYDKLELDVIVGLRDHGVTAERIRSANARAGTRLPLDMIKALAAGGMR